MAVGRCVCVCIFPFDMVGCSADTLRITVWMTWLMCNVAQHHPNSFENDNIIIIKTQEREREGEKIKAKKGKSKTTLIAIRRGKIEAKQLKNECISMYPSQMLTFSGGVRNSNRWCCTPCHWDVSLTVIIPWVKYNTKFVFKTIIGFIYVRVNNRCLLKS